MEANTINWTCYFMLIKWADWHSDRIRIQRTNLLKIILMSVAVTQSCNTGLLSKSYADGLPSRVLNATRDPEMGSVLESAHNGSCSLATLE